MSTRQVNSFLFIIFCLTITKYGIAQGKTEAFEQQCFEYFIDSIASKEYPDIKFIYHEPQVRKDISKLIRDTEFKDYENLDNTSTSIVENQRKQILSDTSTIRLSYLKTNNPLKIKIPSPTKRENKNSIGIIVYKHNIGKPGYFFVEIVANSKSSRTYFFIEINKNNLEITRWYKNRFF